jgi:hypothetical protein
MATAQTTTARSQTMTLPLTDNDDPSVMDNDPTHPRTVIAHR